MTMSAESGKVTSFPRGKRKKTQIGAAEQPSKRIAKEEDLFRSDRSTQIS